ncbi:arylsulfatase A family protein [Lachnospiraceae bacterium JC7]|nr:arylsulfatase A family protein [Lachnospiraceae bacterium JC7]
MSQPDILFFMSDQHTPYFSGFGGNNVDTPEMDSLCRDGIRFSEAYSNCPLCVPARLSMLSSLRPAKTGIFTLDDALPDLTPTFLHYLVEQGYETVLCGRMHFLGNDQRHGFTKRIAHELTPTSWNAPRHKLKEDRGVLTRSFGEPFCTAVVGGGESTVEYYDRYVVDSAIRYLSEDHEKPQFIMVGLYGPHFPYVGDKELYLKYLKRVTLPESFHDPCPTPVLARHVQPVSEKLAISIRAAYSAMVEQTDEKLGQVRKAFDSFCDRRGNGRLFIYTSDHGDQCGDRSMFAKSTFYEKSTKIPLIFAGDGVESGRVCNTPVSIMDIGPTILQHVGAHEMIDVDGVSLASALQGNDVTKHEVYGEFLERTSMKDPADSYCFMLRRGDYKYMSFFDDPDCELLFNIAEDPEERRNLAKELPEVLKELREASKKIAMPEQSVALQKMHTYRSSLMRSYENALSGEHDVERWENTPLTARNYPEICIKNEALTEK